MAPDLAGNHLWVALGALEDFPIKLLQLICLVHDFLVVISPHHRIIYRPGIIHALGGVQNFQAHDIAVLIVVDDYPGLVFVAFFDGGVAEENAQQSSVVSGFTFINILKQILMMIGITYKKTAAL